MFTVYTLPNCMKCNLTKRKLDKHGLPYESVDLTQNAEALSWVRENGYQGAPVIVAPDGNHWNDYRPTLIEEHAAALIAA